jgi:hypothetical protein
MFQETVGALRSMTHPLPFPFLIRRKIPTQDERANTGTRARRKATKPVIDDNSARQVLAFSRNSVGVHCRKRAEIDGHGARRTSKKCEFDAAVRGRSENRPIDVGYHEDFSAWGNESRSLTGGSYSEYEKVALFQSSTTCSLADCPMCVTELSPIACTGRGEEDGLLT